MRLSVIGCGYLGAVHAASMAELGHDVVGVDVDAHKINLLSNGRAPFFEPELEGLLTRNVEAGRLTFTQDFSAIEGAQVHFIGVGTPQSESGAADMTYVDAAVTSMLPHLGHCTSGLEVVAGKSTVPVGTASRLSRLIEPTGALLLWNPEFLREGFAVQDTLRPDRMVYGVPENPDAADARETMDAVYAQILAAGTPRLVMDYATAELVKISANAFLATKISFINAMSQVCDAAGANVTALAEAIGMDDRIGRRFLRAGIGFGGGCLPKDIRAFQARAGELGVGDALAFLAEVDRVNDTMRAGVIRTVRELLGEHTSAATVTVLGAAFKPDSDDMRNSPALDLAVELSGMVERVVVHDPAAGPILAKRTNRPYEVAASAQSALEGTDLVIIGTEWREYRDLDPAQAAGLVRTCYVIDGRNCLDAQAWKAAGWSYRGIGRR
ncbi:UDP-glucose dehydrogenase family protein [Actinomyces oris]|uniref:UDP-glucose 6-dehydrogenase n=1 Tax=Actinomyces oris TaxID=544580 RepID=A0AAW9KSJ6_9ACTO|nr:UDP-glucose/GDP-mannose dehydrogenase family protein [Actinomyces oris]MEA1305388.1 UDP-glucose/GDP-mannose dehydrogenase family protein [Actinomyces oris]OLO60961.1 UDP-glucose 6-dehydrogenase [Actinomyces oris]OLO65357.1 UDP-glucose 6-dehydrogenase [Actinomyces oris]